VELSLLKAKIHGACVTGADANCEGSVAISADLAELVGLEEYERILVSNLANGERFESYAVYGIRNAGAIQLNGATARLGKTGDRLTIMSFGLFDAEEAAIHQPKIIFLDEKNLVTKQH
jgi:aspartate 1-decarboxylase